MNRHTSLPSNEMLVSVLTNFSNIETKLFLLKSSYLFTLCLQGLLFLILGLLL